MKFTIPFNPDFFRRQNMLVWDRLWKKNLDKNTRNLVFGISGVVVSVPLLFVQFITGYVFLIFGFLYSYSAIKYLLYSRKSRKKFLETVEEEIEGHSQHQSVCIWEFEDNYFHYVDYRMDQKIQWFAFAEYEVIGDVLILKLKHNVSPGYLLEGAEVGEDNFAKIREFLSQKIKSNSAPLI